jgi:hypothetical protein
VTLSIIHVFAHLKDHEEKKTFLTRFKDSGVMNAFVIGATPAKETYKNLLKLLQALDMPSFTFPYQIAADLKAMATMTGLSSAGTASFSCPICYWQKKDLAGSGRPCGRTRRPWTTIGDGGKTGLNKNYHNIHQSPLPIYAKSNTSVADLFAFPTVHVHTGIVNHLFKFIEKEFPGIIEWPNRLRLKRHGYHSKVFEVNNAWVDGDIGSKALLRPWVEEVTTFRIAQIRFTKLFDTATTPKTAFVSSF